MSLNLSEVGFTNSDGVWSARGADGASMVHAFVYEDGTIEITLSPDDFEQAPTVIRFSQAHPAATYLLERFSWQ